MDGIFCGLSILLRSVFRVYACVSISYIFNSYDYPIQSASRKGNNYKWKFWGFESQKELAKLFNSTLSTTNKGIISRGQSQKSAESLCEALLAKGVQAETSISAFTISDLSIDTQTPSSSSFSVVSSPFSNTNSVATSIGKRNSDNVLCTLGRDSGEYVKHYYRKMTASHLYYCGRDMKQCICGSCDGRCGPSNGCPCKSCRDLIDSENPLKNSDGSVLFMGTPEDDISFPILVNRLKRSELWYCGRTIGDIECIPSATNAPCV